MSKTQIIFEGIFYIEGDFCEEIVFNSKFFCIKEHYDYAEDIEYAIGEFFGTASSIKETLKQHDSEWEYDPKKPFVNVIGFFEESTGSDGDYENGYYDVIELCPIVIACENLSEEDINEKELLDNEEVGDNYE